MEERERRVHAVRQEIQVILGQSELMLTARTVEEREESVKAIKKAVMKIDRLLDQVMADIELEKARKDVKRGS